MPAAITTVFHDQISRCRSCGSRIAWLRGRSGKPYPVNLLSTSSQGGRARVNDFHNCRGAGEPGDAQTQAAERAAAVAEAHMEHKVPPPKHYPQHHRPCHPGSWHACPAHAVRGHCLRRAVSQALDFYAVAWARYMVETKGAAPQAAASQYWQQMKLLVNDQIDGILAGPQGRHAGMSATPAPARQVADSELDPPADPSPGPCPVCPPRPAWTQWWPLRTTGRLTTNCPLTTPVGRSRCLRAGPATTMSRSRRLTWTAQATSTSAFSASRSRSTAPPATTCASVSAPLAANGTV